MTLSLRLHRCVLEFLNKLLDDESKNPRRSSITRSRCGTGEISNDFWAPATPGGILNIGLRPFVARVPRLGAQAETSAS